MVIGTGPRLEQQQERWSKAHDEDNGHKPEVDYSDIDGTEPQRAVDDPPRSRRRCRAGATVGAVAWCSACVGVGVYARGRVVIDLWRRARAS